MSLPLIIRDDAEADIAEAMAWYNRQRPGLGYQFLESVEAPLQRIEKSPLPLRKNSEVRAVFFCDDFPIP
jgi:hypothetical protein